MMISKNVPQKVREKVVILHQMRQQRNNFISLKRKRKRNITNISKVFAINNDQWPIGTIVIVEDSILNCITEEKLCGKGYLVKVKDFSGSTAGDSSHHIILIIQKRPFD